MPEVSINYKGARIASLDESGTKTLNTGGTWVEGDISVVYDRPASGAVNKTGLITALNNASASQVPVIADFYDTNENFHLYIYIYYGQYGTFFSGCSQLNSWWDQYGDWSSTGDLGCISIVRSSYSQSYIEINYEEQMDGEMQTLYSSNSPTDSALNSALQNYGLVCEAWLLQ